MKKNTILYVLLIVLLGMNSFFIYNYLGRPHHKGPKASGNFIASELKFNDEQFERFENLENAHHIKMRAIRDATKNIKDELFQKITQPNLNQIEIDSLIALISDKEQLKEKEMFKRLRNIYELCDAQQQERFNAIIKKARRSEGPEKPKD